MASDKSPDSSGGLVNAPDSPYHMLEMFRSIDL